MKLKFLHWKNATSPRSSQDRNSKLRIPAMICFSIIMGLSNSTKAKTVKLSSKMTIFRFLHNFRKKTTPFYKSKFQICQRTSPILLHCQSIRFISNTTYQRIIRPYKSAASKSAFREHNFNPKVWHTMKKLTDEDISHCLAQRKIRTESWRGKYA